MFTDLFGKVLDMSFIGCYTIAVVLAVRLLLTKFDKKYAYYLWLIVFINLALPVSFRSNFSLIPKQVAQFSVADIVIVYEEQPIPVDIAEAESPDKINILSPSGQLINPAGLYNAGNAAGEMQKNDDSPKSGKIMHVAVDIAEAVWLLGVAVILLFHAVSMIRLKKQIKAGHMVYWDGTGRVAEIDSVNTPFLWGVLRPVIYLPVGMEEEEKEYVVAHESCHRKRKDYLVKIAVSIIAAVHWFNPLVWLAYILFCRDMETSCDETVLKSAEANIKRQYAESLLKFAARQNGYVMMPLSFGEPSVKCRIKNVLRFKKRKMFFSVIGFICMFTVMLGLFVLPAQARNLNGIRSAIVKGRPWVEDVPEDLTSDNGNGEEVSETESSVETVEQVFSYEPEHREGYKEAELTFAGEEDMYLHPDWWDEKVQEALAQRALRELYDLTGYQVESCCYTYTDNGSFYFGNTKEDLEHSRTFYNRNFGEEEGYSALSVPSMWITSARRVWYSDVQQLDIPGNIEEMENGELAVWFLQHSAIYGQEEIAGTELAFESEPELIRVMLADGSFYEVQLDRKINAVASIYGPYPPGFSH